MISLLQDVARNTSARMGRESLVIRAMRPAYESLLGVVSRGGGVPQVVNGMRFRIDPHQRYRFPAQYDEPVAELLARRVRPGAVCFDVGANAGIYVLQLARWSGPEGSIIAFEPNPAARQILEQHVDLNGLTSRVRIVPQAVGSQTGVATLHASGADGMSRLSEPNSELHGRTVPLHVQVTTIDEYCRQTGLVPDVLLIDIEGFEFAALEGAARTLLQRGKALVTVVEMHPGAWSSAGTTRLSAERLLARLRMRAVPLTGQTNVFEEYGQILLEPLE